jgi:hypothetical protein
VLGIWGEQQQPMVLVLVLDEAAVGGKEGREKWRKKRGEIEIEVPFFFSFLFFCFVSELPSLVAVISSSFSGVQLLFLSIPKMLDISSSNFFSALLFST